MTKALYRYLTTRVLLGCGFVLLAAVSYAVFVLALIWFVSQHWTFGLSFVLLLVAVLFLIASD